MTHSIQEITAKISALPEPMQQEVFNFIEFMYAKVDRPALPSKHEPALLSEQTLATDWIGLKKIMPGEAFSERIVVVSAQVSVASIHLKFDHTLINQPQSETAMQTTYILRAEELNTDFLKSVKVLFHGKVIEIAVSDAEPQQEEQLSILPRKAGALAGRIKMSDDFNAPLADFAEYEK